MMNKGDGRPFLTLVPDEPIEYVDLPFAKWLGFLDLLILAVAIMVMDVKATIVELEEFLAQEA